MATLPGVSVDLLALIVCSIWAVAIATIDLMTFRISNKSLAMGVLIVWPAFLLIGQEFDFTFVSFAFVVFALFCGFASLVGMGDVKLLLFLAPWLHFENLRNPLILLLALAWLQLGIGLVIKRSFPDRIAFAPSILAAAALNMAT
jgi:Flp pilus assembly protein protease CpaA